MLRFRQTLGYDSHQVNLIELPCRKHYSLEGFHLLELLVALSILSILLMISLPRYTDYLMQAARLEATTTLTRLATQLTTYHFEQQTYAGATLEHLHFTAYTRHHHYQIGIRSATANDFLIIAQPATQDTSCGTLSLDARGTKSISGTGEVDNCWSL